MKDKILAALKTKFEGVQESVLNRIAEKLAKTVTTEEGVTTAVEGMTFQKIIDSYADSRATEAASTALKNHRIKLGLDENDKPIQKTDLEPDPNEPAWFKAYREKSEKEVADLKAELEGQKKVKTQAELKTKLIESLKAKGVDELFIPGLTKYVTVESDDKIETLVTEIEATWKDMVQKSAEKGVVISIPPSSSGGGGEGEAIGKAIAERKNSSITEGVKGKEIK